MSASENFVLIGFSISAVAVIVLLLAVLWLSLSVKRLRRECANLAAIVESNKNDLFGLCSAAITVNETTAKSHEQLHELKQQLSHVVDKVTELERTDFVNSAYNVDIRKIRDGANATDLMKQSELSYDEAALLIRLHGKV
jgi:predicted Holliday junction resolvase-like endonuclease